MPQNAAKSMRILWVGKECLCQGEWVGTEFALWCLWLNFCLGVCVGLCVYGTVGQLLGHPAAAEKLLLAGVRPEFHKY